MVKVRNLSVVLRGSPGKLACILSDLLGRHFACLAVSEETWQELAITLYFDPSRELLLGLLDEAVESFEQCDDGNRADQRATVVDDGVVTGTIVLQTPDGIRIELEAPEEESIKLTIDYQPEHVCLMMCVVAELYTHRVDRAERLMTEVAEAVVSEQVAHV